MAYQKKDWWRYWIPGYGHYLMLKDTIETGNPFAGQLHALGIQTKSEREAEAGINAEQNVATILGEVQTDTKEDLLDDREHTEMREDTAYQRAVEDMRSAGLNPYTVGASPAQSSASSVGSSYIATKLQMLGYVLDLKNLDLKNKQVANQTIGNLLRLL